MTVPVDARQRHADLAREVEDLAYRYYLLAQPTVFDPSRGANSAITAAGSAPDVRAQ